MKRVFFLIGFCVLFASPLSALDLDKLSDSDVALRKRVIEKLEPLIQKRDMARDLAKLTFEELYDPLDDEEREFMKKFRKISRKDAGIRIPWRGIATGKEELVIIKGQRVKEKIRVKNPDGTKKTVLVSRTIPPQFLPPDVFVAYRKMMAAMEKDIGKRLYVESGYRSSAFQLYLFVYYLANHRYSIRETVKFVTLPGYSEHGSVKHQAIDFINENGVNGDPNVKEFEALEENDWLLENACRFGFVLSYPKNSPNGITYEPWHWRYDTKAAKRLCASTQQPKARPAS